VKKTSIALGLLSGLLVVFAIIAGGASLPTAEAHPALQSEGENCITCHTDKETLQALAVEPETEEELSEGEG
jgi:nitrate/TMAO reductase-like tetraheme cytochrome c subunit